MSVVVCTLGREPRLVATVRSILDQTHSNLELLVVDNAPDSGRTRSLLVDVDDPRLRILPQPVRGLSAARNAGLLAAQGSLIAYTDDDAVAEATWVEELLRVLRRDDEGVVTCVTGRVTATEALTAEQEWFETAGIFDKGTEPTVWTAKPRDLHRLGRPGTATPLLLLTAGVMGSGNNMLFRTAALRRHGGFDEALGAGTWARGGEDLDIFRRVVGSGEVLVYTPDAVIRHHHRQDYAALRSQMFGYGVGMAAVLTKVLLLGGDPARTLLRSVPTGVHRLLWPTSTKNEKKGREMSGPLLAVEALGYLAGPVLYLRSVLQVRRRRRADVRPSATDWPTAPGAAAPPLL